MIGDGRGRGPAGIPKVIHYCWFGGTPHPAFMQRCMRSWHRHLPDYQIVEWNESTFPLDQNRYAHEAYEAGKFAFVTDYVRLKVLYDHGGVYVDTDVEVVRSLDSFLRHEAFSGFEDPQHIPTAVMGSRAGNQWIGALLADYDRRAFVQADGSFDLTTNVTRITEITRKTFEVRLDNSRQEIPGILSLYPTDFFCPKSYRTGIISTTVNTHAIHHFAGSWRSEEQRRWARLSERVHRLLGVRVGGWVLAARSIWLTEGVVALPGRLARSLRRRMGGG